MAKRKKPRSAAQKAATARMLAAIKAKRSGRKKPTAKPQRAERPKPAKRKKARTPAQIAATERMLAARNSTPRKGKQNSGARGRARSAPPTTTTTDTKFF